MRISSCRLKEKTQDRLAEFFVGGVTARSALVGVNRTTGAYFFHRLRQRIAEQLEDAMPVDVLQACISSKLVQLMATPQARLLSNMMAPERDAMIQVIAQDLASALGSVGPTGEMSSPQECNVLTATR